MADVKNADKRFPDPWTNFKFPYGGCRFSTIDGSGEWFYEKNGQVMTLKYHAPSGTMEYTNGSGDLISINKGNKIDYNMSGETITTEGGASDFKRMSIRDLTLGGRYTFCGGDHDCYNAGKLTTINGSDNNEANMAGKYTGVEKSNRTNVKGNNIKQVAGYDDEKVEQTKTVTVTQGISITSTSDSITQTAAVNHTTIAGGVNTVKGSVVIIGG